MKQTRKPTLQSRFTAAAQQLKKRILGSIDRKPTASFFGFLAILFVVIVIGNFLRNPKTSTKTQEITPKAVSVYSIGQSPKLNLSATIEKSGVIHLVSQAGGVVQGINLTEGSSISRGQWLISLSTNYQGGNIASVTRQIAEKNYNFTNDNFDSQLDLINKQRDMADKLQGQASALRDIATQSANNTQNLVNLDQDLVNTIDSQISNLEASPGAQESDPAIVQAKQAKAGILTGLVSLQTALSNQQYQGDSSKEPAQLANEQHDLTREQLDLQERSLRLNKEISELNLRIAQISESLMFPASPVNGVIERINVHIGQSVSPGTVLATLTANKNSATAVIKVSAELARSISRLEDSEVAIGGKTVTVTPRYISTEPTDGTLFTVLYTIPDEYAGSLSDGSVISIQVPVGKMMTSSVVPFVPIDTMYQTEDQAFLYVASPSGQGTFVATSKPVKVGQVMGDYVQVLSGLEKADQVIIDRTVIEGDVVTIQ